MTTAYAVLLLPLLLLGRGERGCGEARPRGDASVTVAAFVPPGAAVHRAEARTFSVEGREVKITHVEYGQLMDCESGCFASHVCAIEDGEGVLLFYAAWSSGEAPVALATSCPAGATRGTETWPECEPPGRCHALNLEPSFQAWAEGEAGSGPFRWCVNRFTRADAYEVAVCAAR